MKSLLMLSWLCGAFTTDNAEGAIREIEMRHSAFTLPFTLQIRLEASFADKDWDAGKQSLRAALKSTENTFSSRIRTSLVSKVGDQKIGEGIKLENESLFESLEDWKRLSIQFGNEYSPLYGSGYLLWGLDGDRPLKTPSPEEADQRMRAAHFEQLVWDRKSHRVSRKHPETYFEESTYREGKIGELVKTWMGGSLSRQRISFSYGNIQGSFNQLYETAIFSFGLEKVFAHFQDRFLYLSPEGGRPWTLSLKTGRPCENWGQIAVLAKDPMLAQVLAFSLVCMGAEGAREFMQGREGKIGAEVAFLTDKLPGGKPTVYVTAGFEKALNPNPPESKIMVERMLIPNPDSSKIKLGPPRKETNPSKAP